MIGQRLEIRQGQGLVITPQLQQAIKLLQLSNLELEAFVESELEKNPILARDEEGDASSGTDERGESEARDSSGDGSGDGSGDDLSEGLDMGSASEAREALDAREDDLYGDAAPGERGADRAPDAAPEQYGLSGADRAGRGPGWDGEGDGLERLGSGEISLRDHLVEQVTRAGFSPVDSAIALVLIDMVDEGGYLRGALEEVADQLGCELARVEQVLSRCQGFEPTGVMARSVEECLSLQLRERDRLDPAMAALLGNLALLARSDMTGLMRVCGVDMDDLRDMIAELRNLTPRPGAAFGHEVAQTVVPDVVVSADPLGGWRVELNADTLPRLLIDRRYHASVQAGARSDAEKVFVAECLNQANWLIKSLDQRARTILKVASEIVRQQDAFLAFGVECLRPLNLKTVADAIGMHESTVSRVTSNKYVLTPRGTYELKFFFTAAIASTSGGATHSAEAVRHRIKTMIDAEGAEGAVLSDDRIVEILKEAGVDIARRTVAKYREALRIPSSVERRRRFKAAG